VRKVSCYTWAMKLPYRLTRPPASLRRARLDNIALVPASMLFHKAKYKAVANRLSPGSVLICAPRLSKQRRITASVASYFQSHGHKVTTIPMDLMINNQAAL
jgi:hypothetical protein